MKMNIFKAVTMLIVFGSCSANADPITFRFEMPAFNLGSLTGMTSTLDVTVDNGASAIANQSYLNTEITALNVMSGAFSVSLNIFDDVVGLTGAIPYITTDSFGLPTLDLSAAIDSVITLSTNSGPSAIQLGTRDGDGPLPFGVRNASFVFGIVNSPPNVVVAGTGPVSVPEPGTLTLLGIGLIGLRLARRKTA